MIDELTVVYLLTPTSNHNHVLKRKMSEELYIFWLLHQTTTSSQSRRPAPCCISFDSYIKPQHHVYYKSFGKVVYLLTPTSNHNLCVKIRNLLRLYIFWLLHQTTTSKLYNPYLWSCISFDSYIKPQLNKGWYRCFSVVYLLTPTSNHNSSMVHNENAMLYIFWLLHQTTTLIFSILSRTMLYIFWLLHQTTTLIVLVEFSKCCISFDSYIKPQQDTSWCSACQVVYLLTPTSNHNCFC